jgi:hypothetical protein
MRDEVSPAAGMRQALMGAAGGVALIAVIACAGLPAPARAQASGGDAATIADLRRQLDQMRRRLEELEARIPPPAPAARRQPAAVAVAPVPAPAEARAAAAEARAAAAEARAAAAAAAGTPLPAGTIPGLQPAAAVGTQAAAEDALRSDLPGIAFRVPGTDTQVRLYGFVAVTGSYDFGPRNQTDAPAPQGIPLTGSLADRQGGDFLMSGRFSRLGLDTRSLTPWGTLETRIEGDFGGGAPGSTNAVFRLRQAWAELGDERLRVLIGQTNSLWNEGVFETLIDATNLNQSFVRQAQLRLTARLAPALIGQISIEAPETGYTAVDGAFTPGGSLQGGASPAFSSVPDLLTRLTWRPNGMEFGLRGLLRQLELRTDGTAAAATAGGSARTAGWGLAAHMRLPLRLVWAGLGADEFAFMTFVGDGIGRYFAGQTFGLDAVTNLGLGGVTSARLDTVGSYGVTLAYRRLWTDTLRSTFSYAYARNDFPAYVSAFTPGSAPATSLNRELQQVFVNLIWSPFGTVREGVFGSGWLDLGVEYVFTRRDVEGGSRATAPGVAGHGTANRALFRATARF